MAFYLLSTRNLIYYCRCLSYSFYVALMLPRVGPAQPHPGFLSVVRQKHDYQRCADNWQIENPVIIVYCLFSFAFPALISSFYLDPSPNI